MDDSIFEWILKVEGGYVNDEDDMGGETNYGITAGALQYAFEHGFVTHSYVDQLTLPEVRSIYEKMYYNGGKCNLIKAPIDIIHFDMCVNSGRGNAGRNMQKTLNLFLPENSKLLVDGILGSKTFTAFNNIGVDTGTKCFVQVYLMNRVIFINKIVQRNKNQSKFLHGWLNRIQNLQEVALKRCEDFNNK